MLYKGSEMAQITSIGFHVPIAWKLIVFLFLLPSTTAFFTNHGGTLAPSVRIQRQSYGFTVTLLSALNDRKNNDNDNDKSVDSKDDNRRKVITGLLFPLTIALGANAPFLYVIANPPSAKQRDAMLMDFCKGDVCTLLGGGSGFVGGDSGGNYAGDDVARSLPTSEEYEAMAAAAAELAGN